MFPARCACSRKQPKALVVVIVGSPILSKKPFTAASTSSAAAVSSRPIMPGVEKMPTNVVLRSWRPALEESADIRVTWEEVSSSIRSDALFSTTGSAEAAAEGTWLETDGVYPGQKGFSYFFQRKQIILIIKPL